jgi:hypothetical protein
MRWRWLVLCCSLFFYIMINHRLLAILSAVSVSSLIASTSASRAGLTQTRKILRACSSHLSIFALSLFRCLASLARSTILQAMTGWNQAYLSIECQCRKARNIYFSRV